MEPPCGIDWSLAFGMAWWFAIGAALAVDVGGVCVKVAGIIPHMEPKPMPWRVLGGGLLVVALLFLCSHCLGGLMPQG